MPIPHALGIDLIHVYAIRVMTVPTPENTRYRTIPKQVMAYHVRYKTRNLDRCVIYRSLFPVTTISTNSGKYRILSG